MAGAKGRRTIDWEYWRHKWITSELSLAELSRVQGAPALQTLKNKAHKDAWSEQKKAFKYHASTIASQGTLGQQAIAQTQQLVDAAEMITRHLQMAKAVQSIAVKRLKEFDPNDLSARDLIYWIKEATNIDRLAMGLNTDRHEVNIKVDFSSLSDDQLDRLVKGEDPAHVLN